MKPLSDGNGRMFVKIVTITGSCAVTAARRLLAVGVLSLFVFPAIVAVPASSGEPFNALDNGVAMDGFDVVAYFQQGAPAKGSESHQVQHKGKSW
jgi:hypothetical protein